jgi:hypothetical protein
MSVKGAVTHNRRASATIGDTSPSRFSRPERRQFVCASLVWLGPVSVDLLALDRLASFSTWLLLYALPMRLPSELPLSAPKRPRAPLCSATIRDRDVKTIQSHRDETIVSYQIDQLTHAGLPE